ncbi:MAG: hypothetical protein IPG53_23820 [Ignavibacteriales bacterium]|nr:hypothetical protein [Ignavibacteriales bacterium]
MGVRALAQMPKRKIKLIEAVKINNQLIISNHMRLSGMNQTKLLIFVCFLYFFSSFPQEIFTPKTKNPHEEGDKSCGKMN